MPVLEATHFGSPLVLADTPVFRELADGLARFVPLAAPSGAVAAALDVAWGTPPDAVLRERLLARCEGGRGVARRRGGGRRAERPRGATARRAPSPRSTGRWPGRARSETPRRRHGPSAAPR